MHARFVIMIATLAALSHCSRDSVPARPGGNQIATATFAGGCFWCMEPPFESLEGVVSVTSGYTGGEKSRPSYGEVSEGGTGHFEAVEIAYDPSRISYRELLDVFWRNIDPANGQGQFCDEGHQYRSAIFVHDEPQRELAEDSKRTIARTKKLEVVTEIFPVFEFFRAEEYHQDYAKKHPVRYKIYRLNCGRDYRLSQIWGASASH